MNHLVSNHFPSDHVARDPKRNLITYPAAISILRELAATRKGSSEEVGLFEAIGRVSARDYTCAQNIPAFANSAMDGFAVQSKNLIAASSQRPIRLEVLGSISAGDQPPPNAIGNGAWEIMTGAPIPDGYDAVVRIEDVEVMRDSLGHPKQIILKSPAESGQHYRGPGEDFHEGSLILKRGTWITPEYVLGLAAAGISIVSVVKKPRVVVISTGSELIQHDCVERVEDRAKVRNSTAPFLKAVLERAGAQVIATEVVSDEPEQLKRLIRRILSESPDLILTTGGVSMGKHDYVKSALLDLGAELCFHKIQMRPGKPNLLASFSGGTTVFGLPGNPVSTVVGLRFLVEPYLREWMGRPQERAWRAQLTGDTHHHTSASELRCFYKASLQVSHQGAQVSILPGQASFMISPLLQANAWAVLPEKASSETSSWVDVFPLYSLENDHKWEPGIISGTKGRECC